MKTNPVDFLLDELYVHRIKPFFSFGYVKRHIVFFADLVDQTGYVNENIFTTVYWGDESETLGLIEEFYYAFLHGDLI